MNMIEERAKRIKSRRKPKLNEDTLAMQDRYIKEGRYSAAEMAYRMASDAYENKCVAEEAYGPFSEEYNDAFNKAQAAIKTALPYLAVSMKAELVTLRETAIGSEEITDGIMSLINARSK